MKELATLPSEKGRAGAEETGPARGGGKGTWIEEREQVKRWEQISLSKDKETCLIFFSLKILPKFSLPLLHFPSIDSPLTLLVSAPIRTTFVSPRAHKHA